MPQSKNKKPDFSHADMTVYEVKDERPSLPLPRPINPVLPDIPGILLFLMKCKSGKSNMIANLLNREEYFADIFDKIIIVSPTVKNHVGSLPCALQGSMPRGLQQAAQHVRTAHATGATV